MKFQVAGQTGSRTSFVVILLACAVVALSVLLIQSAPAAVSSPPASPPAASAPPVPAPTETPIAPAQGTDSSAQAEAPSAPEKIIPAQEKQRIQQALLSDVFTFEPKGVIDPFDPFIKAPAPKIPAPSLVENEIEEQPLEPLTPLQKMTVSEIEKGLKGIVVGTNGKRALIEDPTGKGYIIDVGVPLGESNGVVTQIFGDGMVIQQQVKDRKTKEMTAQNVTIRLKKPEEGK